MINYDEKIKKLEEQIEQLKKKNKERSQKIGFGKIKRLEKIGIINPCSCACYITLIARYAVDNEGYRKGRSNNLYVKDIYMLTEKQTRIAAELAEKIVDLVEETYAQKAWLDDAET